MVNIPVFLAQHFADDPNVHFEPNGYELTDGIIYLAIAPSSGVITSPVDLERFLFDATPARAVSSELTRRKKPSEVMQGPRALGIQSGYLAFVENDFATVRTEYLFNPNKVEGELSRVSEPENLARTTYVIPIISARNMPRFNTRSASAEDPTKHVCLYADHGLEELVEVPSGDFLWPNFDPHER